MEVQANKLPVWGQDVQLVEDLRIGMLEGPDEYVFGAISAVTVGLDGSIYVYDRLVPIIRQYDANGEHVRNIGRDGEGPGEYRRVMGMHVLGNGRLAIWDPGNNRITVYDSTGFYLASHNVPSSLFAANTFAIDSAGYYYVKAIDLARFALLQNRSGPGGAPAIPGEFPKLLIRVSPSGELADSIVLPPEDKDQAFVLMTSEGPRWNFPTATSYAWSPLGYLVVGRNDRYVFDMLLPQASVRRIVRDFEPVRLHRQERAQWEAWTEFFEGRGNRDYGAVPEAKPAYRGFAIGTEGRVWVSRYAEAVKRDVEPRDPGDERPVSEWRQQPTFDVFEPDGTYLGTIVVPRNTSLVVRKQRQAWGVYSGEFDEQYVVRFAIESAIN